MKNILSIGLLSLALLISSVATAQTKKSKRLKQEDPKKKEQQDTTKKPAGTRMAINSAGLPTKGKKSTPATNNNRTVSDPKADPKKDEGKKTDEKK